MLRAKRDITKKNYYTCEAVASVKSTRFDEFELGAKIVGSACIAHIVKKCKGMSIRKRRKDGAAGSRSGEIVIRHPCVTRAKPRL